MVLLRRPYARSCSRRGLCWAGVLQVVGRIRTYAGVYMYVTWYTQYVHHILLAEYQVVRSVHGTSYLCIRVLIAPG